VSGERPRNLANMTAAQIADGLLASKVRALADVKDWVLEQVAATSRQL
jgi:hypothetical protein